MKLVFASDIHGSAYYARMLPEIDRREAPERIVLLGDLLYHGPRNDLPAEYNPKEVISILNGMKERFLCVRGNCDAEVDQMVLEFPILSDSMVLFLNGRMAFVTHGHLFNTQNPPPLNYSRAIPRKRRNLQNSEAGGLNDGADQTRPVPEPAD